jgi:hypothetical protein
MGNNTQFRMKTSKKDSTQIARHREDNNIQTVFGK